jgi:hypothetical protein
MARSVTFGGQTQYKPGGLTRINTDGTLPINASPTGIIQMVGEAEGGEPGVVQQIDDPSLAKTLFRSGPLADAIKIAFSASGDTRVPGGASRVLAYKTNNSTQSSIKLAGSDSDVLVSDTVSASPASTATVIQLTTGGLTIDQHIGRWLLVSGVKRRIQSNTATAVTVDPGFPAAPASPTAVKILNNQLSLTSRDYGSHTNQISVEFESSGSGSVVTLAFEDTIEQSEVLGGDSFLNLRYDGGPVLASGPVVSWTDSLHLVVNPASAPSANAWDAKIIRFNNGIQRLIASHDTADPTAVVLATGHGLTTQQQASATSVEIINVSAATASIVGANGLATKLTSSVTSTPASTADNLDLTFATLNLTTLREFVTYVNANTNWVATIPNGVNPDTTLMSSFDFGTRNTAVNCRFDAEYSPISYGTFCRDLQVVVDWINNFSTLATAVKASTAATEGSQLPGVTGGSVDLVRDVPVFFLGGTRGVSINSSFQDGFDSLIQERGNHCVPLISSDMTGNGTSTSKVDFATVAAQLSAHVQLGRGMGKNEMGGYIGMQGTLTQVLAQAKALNDTDVQLFPQKMVFTGAENTLKLMPEWASAVAAASMRAGTNEVGDPLTFKFIKTSQFTQDTSWAPTDRTSVNKLIAGGVMFAESAPAGIRWVRDLTTYLKDDNICYMDGNIREEIRYLAYDLRQSIEDQFTGLKAKPATAASIRDFVVAKMDSYLNQGIITQSLDPETLSVTLPGYRNLRIFIDGNVATIRVEIFPASGIVFTLNDISLQIPHLTA